MALPFSPQAVRHDVSVASKTFFVGEYAALQGGPSLIAATKPRFFAVFDRSASTKALSAFHPESPAGRFWRSVGLCGWSTDWQDPHFGSGGFGASTAQFAAALALNDCANGESRLVKCRAWTTILQMYRECAWSGVGLAPSGADLVAQIEGRLCAFDGLNNSATSSDWPFTDLDFALIRTGTKLATHDHLQGRAAALAPIDQLRDMARAAITALDAQDKFSFCAAIEAYGSTLAASGLVAERTQIILASVRAALGSDLLAAKGCGAMGADVILLIFAKDANARIDRYLAAQGLARVASSQDLTQGILFDAEAL